MVPHQQIYAPILFSCIFLISCSTGNSETPSEENQIVDSTVVNDEVEDEYLVYWRWVEDDFNQEEKDRTNGISAEAYAGLTPRYLPNIQKMG